MNLPNRSHPDSLPIQQKSVLALPSHQQLSASSVIWGAIGLAALLGITLYATRRPRTLLHLEPVRALDLMRYMGTWYCITCPQKQSKQIGLRLQTEYSLNPNGNIHITYRDYHPNRGKWRLKHSKASPLISADIGIWKTASFGFFETHQHIVAHDENYQWAMIVGNTLDDFWILSRTHSLPDKVTRRLLHHAHLLGVNTQRLHWIYQDGVNPTGSYKAGNHWSKNSHP